MILAASMDDAATTSSRVGASTVIGMVLGVCESTVSAKLSQSLTRSACPSVSLFSIVTAYQFIGRKRKPSPTIRSLAPPPPKPTPLLIRLRTSCTTFFSSLFSRTQPAPDQRQPGTHRTMRSFHLTSERRQQREAMRKRLASTLRINVDLPLRRNTATLDEKKSPGLLGRARYKRLDGDEESQAGLLQPDTALLSPWSPSEEYYSNISPARFCTTPGPVSPPPAYMPSTPQRGTFRHRASDWSTDPPTPSTLSPTTPITPLDGSGGTDATTSLIAEVEEVIQFTKEWADNPFVVADGDDDDAKSDASSDWGTSTSV